jgi:hypothetical protein
MTRVRKPKIKNDKTIEFVLEMSKFSTCLQDLVNYIQLGCNIEITLPTVRSLLIKELGDDGYKDLTEHWRTIRS